MHKIKNLWSREIACNVPTANNIKYKQMRKIFAISLFFLFFLYKGFAQHDCKLTDALNSITADDIIMYVKEMISPEYKGRLSGTPEYMKIAQWAANMFKQWNLEPFGDNETYFQYFNHQWCDVLLPGKIILSTDTTEKHLIVKDEYYPGSNSDSGNIKAPLVFAGYGISFPEMDYDDYADIDVSGKIVLIAGGVPYKGNNVDTASAWTFYNSPRYKYTNAHNRGAAGALIVEMMASPSTPYYADFLYASVHHDVAKYIMSTENMDYDSVLHKISVSMQPFTFHSKFYAEIEANTECYPSGISANVIGFIEGNDTELKDEVIIIGAHLDGQGYLGFLLPGALDNASGSAIVISVAKAFSQIKGSMKRSLMFILFGGEECGLLGSIHYIENSKLPLENVILMLNLDMVGNGTQLATWGGLSYPSLQKHFEKSNNEFINRKFRTSENRPVISRPRTDGMVFLLNNIPTIHFSITDQEFPVYYHSHKDTDEFLSWQTMKDAAKLLFLSVFSIANDTDL